ncbi:MAG: hypothetical protein D6678_06995 [Zetaproteobacteria bacterium]|nr:MAG: hypothetical protein D6678_06995 [Zetaproteobacteria bacterium]
MSAAGGGLALRRRGCLHGYVRARRGRKMPEFKEIERDWRSARAIHLPGMLLAAVPGFADAIADALQIMRRVRSGESCLDILDEPRYRQRLLPDFEMLAAVHSGHDPQELEKIAFDAVKSGELFAEDIWLKVSRLSFHEQDASIRFRFSYGMEMFKAQEDDPLRERLAAELAERVFPECGIVSEHAELTRLLHALLGFAPAFVERIIYSNAPEGGAQFHQDVEQGHHGVLYAQLYGRTAWLALPRDALLREMTAFVRDELAASGLAADEQWELRWLCAHPEALIAQLEAEDQGVVERLLNQTPAFTRRLVTRGWGRVLQPGDVLLLPQHAVDACCWHAVFCLDDEPGHALSFALARLVA